MNADAAIVLPAGGEVAVQLDIEQVRRVREELAAVIAAANTVMETLRAIGGPDPGPFASKLRVQVNMGAGYFRTSVADIEAAWMALNVHRRAQERAAASSGGI